MHCLVCDSYSSDREFARVGTAQPPYPAFFRFHLTMAYLAFGLQFLLPSLWWTFTTELLPMPGTPRKGGLSNQHGRPAFLYKENQSSANHVSFYLLFNLRNSLYLIKPLARRVVDKISNRIYYSYPCELFHKKTIKINISARSGITPQVIKM